MREHKLYVPFLLLLTLFNVFAEQYDAPNRDILELDAIIYPISFGETFNSGVGVCYDIDKNLSGALGIGVGKGINNNNLKFYIGYMQKWIVYESWAAVQNPEKSYHNQHRNYLVLKSGWEKLIPMRKFFILGLQLNFGMAIHISKRDKGKINFNFLSSEISWYRKIIGFFIDIPITISRTDEFPSASILCFGVGFRLNLLPYKIKNNSK